MGESSGSAAAVWGRRTSRSGESRAGMVRVLGGAGDSRQRQKLETWLIERDVASDGGHKVREGEREGSETPGRRCMRRIQVRRKGSTG